MTLFGLDIILRHDRGSACRAGDGQPCHAGFGHGTHDGRQHAARLSVYGSYDTLRNCGVGYVSDTQYMVVFSKMPGLDAVGNVLEDCHFGGMAGKCVLVTSEDDNGVPEQLTIRRNVFLVVGCDQWRCARRGICISPTICWMRRVSASCLIRCLPACGACR